MLTGVYFIWYMASPFNMQIQFFLFQQALLNCNFWTFHCLSLVCFQGLLDFCMSSVFLHVFFSIHIFSSDISLFPSFCTTFYFLFLLQYFPCSYAYSSLVLISKILLNFLLCFLPKYLFTYFSHFLFYYYHWSRKHLLLIIWIFFKKPFIAMFIHVHSCVSGNLLFTLSLNFIPTLRIVFLIVLGLCPPEKDFWNISEVLNAV